MLWEEHDPKPNTARLDEVVDLLFRMDCRELPVDHLYALSQTLIQLLPQMLEDSRFGIHEVHLAGAQNGWERPDPALGQHLMLPKRTRLIIRVPAEFADDIQTILLDKTLNVEGNYLQIGAAKIRKLSKLCTIFTRHLALEPGEEADEEQLLERVVDQLQSQNIRVNKALCGTLNSINTPEGPLLTRSIMLADLTAEAAIQLQCDGFGSHRHMGCGIFLPHKGIEAVNQQQTD